MKTAIVVCLCLVSVPLAALVKGGVIRTTTDNASAANATTSGQVSSTVTGPPAPAIFTTGQTHTHEVTTLAVNQSSASSNNTAAAVNATSGDEPEPIAGNDEEPVMLEDGDEEEDDSDEEFLDEL